MILYRIKIIEFYLVMLIPVLFGLITYKELKFCIQKAKKDIRSDPALYNGQAWRLYHRVTCR